MFLSGYCGIIAELSLFTLAESLIGGTLVNLLSTMGVMMFCMGLGALLAGQPFMARWRYGAFISLELLISLSVLMAIPCITHLAGFWPMQTIWAFVTASAMIGTLIGMEIPLMQKIMQDEAEEDIQVIASRVMMADYFGGLCGFVLFSSSLLQMLGLPWMAATSAILNFSIALLVSFKNKCPTWGRWASLGTLLIFLVFGLQLNSIMKLGEQGLYRHKIVWEQQTPYQKLVLVDQNLTGNPRYDEVKYAQWKAQVKEILSFPVSAGLAVLGQQGRDFSLFINGGLQFNSLDEGVYHENLIHTPLALVPSARRVLVMGGGDGLAVREILKIPSIEYIELVELDPAMTQAFSIQAVLVKLNQGSLLHPKVRIVHEDAWTWARQERSLFDAIVLDFPDPHHLGTAKLYSVEFYKLLRHNLSKGGVLTTQATSPLYNKDAFGSIRQTLIAAGFGVCSTHVEMASFGQWGFHIASANLTGAEMKKFLWDWQPELKLNWVNQESVRGSLCWRPNFIESFEALPVNDLFHLPLAGLYRQY